MKRIATHKQPDPDAVVAAWLAERYLFHGQSVEVVFIARKQPVQDKQVADCVVDAWNIHDPKQLIFDHKPPAFADRNETCATKLVWDYLVSQGKSVRHLVSLVQAVHEGDRNPPVKGGAALKQSRQNGFHAYFKRVRPLCSSDEDLYSRMRAWLDEYDKQTQSDSTPATRLRMQRNE
jgi:hypothetical protein